VGSRGYQLIATGQAKYVDLAAACAASLRIWDGTRPIQLVTDLDLTGYPDRALFDHVTTCVPDPDLFGAMVKLRAYDLSIFDDTMFIDADCLLLKPDMDRHWDDLLARDFAIVGHWRETGEWYDMAVADMCRAAGIARLVQLNSGGMWFRKGETAAAVFAEAKALFARLGNFTRHIHHGGAASDEPYLGLAMGVLGVDPYPLRDAAGRAWITSTHRVPELQLDALSGETALVRPDRIVSPSICHFVSLRPRELYDRLAADLLVEARRRMGIAAA
jgi:hypothetical protein